MYRRCCALGAKFLRRPQPVLRTVETLRKVRVTAIVSLQLRPRAHIPIRLPSKRYVARLERVRSNTVFNPIHERVEVVGDTQTWPANTTVPNTGHLKVAKEVLSLRNLFRHVLVVEHRLVRKDTLVGGALPRDELAATSFVEREVGVAGVHDAGVLVP